MRFAQRATEINHHPSNKKRLSQSRFHLSLRRRPIGSSLRLFAGELGGSLDHGLGIGL